MPFQSGLISLKRRGRGCLLSKSGLKLATTQKGRTCKGVKMPAAAPHAPHSPRWKAIHNCLYPSLFSPGCNYFKQQNSGLFYSNPKTHHFHSHGHFPRPCFKHPAPQPSPALAYSAGQPLNSRRSNSQNSPLSLPPPPFALPLPPFSIVCTCACMFACGVQTHTSVPMCPCVEMPGGHLQVLFDRLGDRGPHDLELADRLGFLFSTFPGICLSTLL